MPNPQIHMLVSAGVCATAAIIEKYKRRINYHLAIAPVACKNFTEVGHDHIIY